MSSPEQRSQRASFFSFLLVACLLLCGIAGAAPSITLSKKSGPPTSGILVSGRGFRPNVGVDIYFDTKDRALIVTNGEGEFENVRIHVPRSARPGKHWVTALERNNDKGAQKPFLVQTNWSQFRFGPQRDGFNPFENVLNPDTVPSLRVKWVYHTGSFNGVCGAPVVVDGMVYVHSYYHLYALNAETGRLRWKFTPVNDIIGSDPAVAGGILYVGTSAGSGLYALNAKTGVVLWNYTSLRYHVSTPLVADGLIHFGDEYGTFYTLNARTGELLWKIPLGSTASSSGAVANGVLYISDGDLYAFDAKTGVPLWDFRNGYIDVSEAAVANGIVYVGGTNNEVYALEASTGDLLWSYDTQNLIWNSPAVADGAVYISPWFGTLFALDAYTGDLLWSYATGANTLSDATVANGVVYVGSKYPDNVSAFGAASGKLLWSYATGGYVEDPTVANGVVYATACDDGKFYAFTPSNQANATVNPPQSGAKRPDLKALHPDVNLKVSAAGHRAL
jgi:outer membrane protein assembly factor BamB